MKTLKMILAGVYINKTYPTIQATSANMLELSRCGALVGSRQQSDPLLQFSSAITHT